MSSASMQSVDQLFEYRLREMLGAEREIACRLDRLGRCQSNPQLQQVFETHLAETRNQIDRLQQVFSILGQQAMPTVPESVLGIVHEHDRFVREQRPAPQIHAVFDAGAGQKIEQLEIVAYEQLVDLAGALGYQQAAQLLRNTLDEERQQLRRIQELSASLGIPRRSAQRQISVQSRQRQAGGQTIRQQESERPIQRERPVGAR